jgi:hypothetical protein
MFGHLVWFLIAWLDPLCFGLISLPCQLMGFFFALRGTITIWTLWHICANCSFSCWHYFQLFIYIIGVRMYVELLAPLFISILCIICLKWQLFPFSKLSIPWKRKYAFTSIFISEFYQNLNLYSSNIMCGYVDICAHGHCCWHTTLCTWFVLGMKFWEQPKLLILCDWQYVDDLFKKNSMDHYFKSYTCIDFHQIWTILLSWFEFEWLACKGWTCFKYCCHGIALYTWLNFTWDFALLNITNDDQVMRNINWLICGN